MSVGPWLQVVFLGMVLIAIITIVVGVIALRSLSDENKTVSDQDKSKSQEGLKE